MPRPANTQLARGHLRLAPTPAPVARRRDGRAALVARGLLVSVTLAWLALVALVSAAVALLPLLWTGAPLGRRLRPPAPREARIIPFQARRQALPR
ncbi:MAG TPA: hypothetical protein VFM45_12540 [Anaeromyxobacteraceae bacterium]|nr:hypothetical protein [Anaeromyxobacteraceae bacterium]